MQLQKKLRRAQTTNTVLRRQPLAHIDLSNCHGIEDIARDPAATELEQALGGIGSERWMELCPVCRNYDLNVRYCERCQGAGVIIKRREGRAS